MTAQPVVASRVPDLSRVPLRRLPSGGVEPPPGNDAQVSAFASVLTRSM